MLKKIRNSYTAKVLSVVLSIQIFSSAIGLNYSFAGDGGPTLPEGRSFEPVGTDQMVDPFTGDFTYNIPLFNIPGPDGGYPINLAYHSGVNMEQEASWVGLGWNINVGTINRQVRNLPDDFGGDNSIKEMASKTDMRADWTVGAGYKRKKELVGFDQAQQNLSIAKVNLYYNNYKGIGYTLDIGYSWGFAKGLAKPVTSLSGNVGFDLSLDSQEGISSRYSVGGSYSSLLNRTSAGVSTGFNSRTGWQRDIGVSASYSKSLTNTHLKPKSIEDLNNSYSTGGGANLSFSNISTQMSIPNAMRGVNANLALAKGINTIGFLNANKSASIFFNISKLKDKNQLVHYNGVGYMYYQKSIDSEYDLENDTRIKDVSRENDGLIHKNSRRLATPSLSYDVYCVTGQGIGNMFRPFRDDIGTVVAPRVKSENHGGNLGLEKGIPTPLNRFGVDVGYNYSHNKVDFWDPDNTNAANYSFTSNTLSLSDGVYFQNYGEQSVDDIGYNYGTSIASEKPVTFGLELDNGFFNITNKDKNNGDNPVDIKATRTSRKRRAKDIEAFTNKLIMDMSYSTTCISDFKLDYYTAPSSGVGYNQANRSNYDGIRSTLPKTQVGGYMATNESGMRYIYGLPAMNKKEKDVVFTVSENTNDVNSTKKNFSFKSGSTTEIDYKKNGTDKYYNSIEKSQYAHSYLMTSILGQDYVDVDNVVGPSNNDLGYWVKFDYTRTASNYKWKAPYDQALYNKGFETSYTDGKGQYSYGEKEVWYMATAETKTHIAEFIISPRKDGKEVNGEFNNGSSTSNYMKLDRIDVYAKSERYPNGVFNSNAKPIQSCNFVYDYSLCKNTPDNDGNSSGIPNANELSNDRGKLTLKKFYFTYRNNQSGKSRPYKFDYNYTVKNNGVITTPTYNRENIDRWGNYMPSTNASNVDYPYIDPFTTKEDMDTRAALWNLSIIDLPSGGRYTVDYESDTYAYVQNQVAMQMFGISSLDPYSTNSNGVGNINHPEVANSNQDHPDRRNVYFKLEKPISSSLSSAQIKNEIEKYIKKDEYIYFKVKINVTKNVNTKEYVSGYTRVQEINVDNTSLVNGQYLWGYVQLDFMKVDGKVTNFHPFTETGARHLKYNQPDLLYDNPPNASNDKLSKSEVKNMGWSLISNVTDIKDMFTNFTKMIYSGGDGRCTDIELLKSYLRLRTPDKVKYGGGHRVKSIKITDNWANSFSSSPESSSTYGTVYDYNMKDENGNVISSGVASYEPLIGGDENPFRKPVKGWEDKNVATKNLAQTYSEDPANESLFPSASVGYREVRVMSLVTSDKVNGVANIPSSYSGITVNRFYTAKDFPVIFDQSELEENKTFIKKHLMVPALVVNVDRTRVAASQGYYIELNDMHGKPLNAEELSIDSQGNEQSISKVEYSYFDDGGNFRTNDAGENFKIRKLDNNVDVIYSDIKSLNEPNSDIRRSTIATEVEFVPEVRYVENKQINGALEVNVEYQIFPPFFLLYPIANFNWRVEKTGTVVTNKIINKSGIIKSLTASQRGSTVTTENLAFDDITGQPLLTTVTNDFGDKVYNYSILAKNQYEGTKGAYENIGFTTFANVSSTLGTNGLQQISLINSSDINNLFNGDVLVAIPVNTLNIEDNSRSKVMCVFNSTNGSNTLLLETNTALNNQTKYKFIVVKSGKKNLLNLPISKISALSDPTKNRTFYLSDDRKDMYRKYELNNVLSINAYELSSNWYKDTRQITNVPNNWYDEKYYTKGFSGIYSVIRPYVYVADRVQSSNVNLRTDGVMNNVELYNWQNSLTYLSPNWKNTSQVTLKNASNDDIESKNALGIYSAKIYGNNGTQPIAVSINSKNTEIGFESFEEYANGLIPISKNGTTNLNFYSSIDNTTRYAEDRFEITYGVGNTTNFIDIPVNLVSGSNLIGYSDYTLKMTIDTYELGSTLVPKKEILLKISPTFSILNGKVKMSFIDSRITPYNNNNWRGELFARKTIPNKITSGANTGNALVTVGTKGHTGEKCLTIQGETAQAEFLQEKLVLIPNKKYQFTGWFSSPNNNFLQQNWDNLFSTNLTLKFYGIDGTLLSTQPYLEKDILQGGFIDEWQKFTVNFTAPVNAHYLSVMLPTTHEVYSYPVDNYVTYAYFDDLRIQPIDGQLESYVYNQQNQRLEAVLDANNYATFYYYDDEGNLFLVKQETEKGIITKQESRSFIKKN
jgi:hypothetical protein